MGSTVRSEEIEEFGTFGIKADLALIDPDKEVVEVEKEEAFDEFAELAEEEKEEIAREKLRILKEEASIENDIAQDANGIPNGFAGFNPSLPADPEIAPSQPKEDDFEDFASAKGSSDVPEGFAAFVPPNSTPLNDEPSPLPLSSSKADDTSNAPLTPEQHAVTMKYEEPLIFDDDEEDDDVMKAFSKPNDIVQGEVIPTGNETDAVDKLNSRRSLSGRKLSLSADDLEDFGFSTNSPSLTLSGSPEIPLHSANSSGFNSLSSPPHSPLVSSKPLEQNDTNAQEVSLLFLSCVQ